MPSRIEDELIKVAVAHLNKNAGEHKRVRWHLDVKRESVGLEPTSYAGSFDSEDEEAIEQDLDFIGGHMLGGKVAPIIAASNATDPVATIDFAFERDGSDWKHRGFVHTVAQREALEADRAELDGRLREALGTQVADGWTRVAVTYSWDSPMRVVRIVNGKPEKLPPSAVDEVMAHYVSFFAKRALEIRFMTGAIESKPDRFELKLSYGAPRAVSESK